MSENSRNLVLIGMPGSGKSTVGVLLAKALAMGFIDTDLLIQADQGRTLQAIADEEGYERFRHIEEAVLSRLEVSGQVISTGGSAVYSDRAMNHLKQNGVVVFLDVPLATVQARIGDYSLRGISKRPDQSLEDLFRERHQLYARYADITIKGDAGSQGDICKAVRSAFADYNVR
ncbi:shikimate kinase [Marinobacter zhejiangensis]|uniref:Shikimate kinase n=1 Tax=Marinobacter zhejiangensis TaxID=488535 RepID=A0A1I4QA33_9GAMM|nr:shikimate kinase [Marinobacter zhejiangensis]SFM36460.1 shikimate kinase [Marinobacter zhejiangensis]